MIGKPRQSKASNALYEHVLTKNFQIIQTFLSQFHQLFKKQDQLEASVGKIEQRIILIQQNDKRLEELMFKSSEMYEKKMKSLKQYVLEKLKNSGEKINFNSQQPHESDSRNELRRQMSTQYEKHMAEQKRIQERMVEEIKKLQWQLSNVNLKVGSLTALTNNLDERVSSSVKINNDFFEEKRNISIKQIQTQIENKSSQFYDKLNIKIRQLRDDFLDTQGQINKKFEKVGENIEECTKNLDGKLGVQQFKQFKLTYKDDLSCLIAEIQQNFANKKQTKNMLKMMGKKLAKFELEQRNSNQNDDNRMSGNVTPNSSQHKPKLLSIHLHKKESKADLKIDSSINIRRISNRKFTEEKMF